MLPYLPVFGFKLPMFGLLMFAGIAIALLIGLRLGKQRGFFEDDLLSAILAALVGGFLGAKILYWLVELDEILADPSSFVDMLLRGFVFYGALVGGLIAIFLFCRRKKQPFFSYIDLFLPCTNISHAFGRIGCFCAGCCYGRACESPLSVVFPAAAGAAAGVPRLPVQLFEAAFLLLLAGFLFWLLRTNRPTGTVTGWYLVLYGVWRFFIEFFRDDDRGAVAFLSTSQFIGIFIVAAGVVLLVLAALGRIVSRETE